MKIDLDRAIDAFRWACPDSMSVTHIDETEEICFCYAVDGKSRGYKCKGNICPRLQKFIDILKEQQQ